MPASVPPPSASLSAWDKYLADFDAAHHTELHQLAEAQTSSLFRYQRSLQDDLTSRPPLLSRELLQWRRRQMDMAGAGSYLEAQRIKAAADRMEDTERDRIRGGCVGTFARREANFVRRQEREQEAAVQRAEGRRAALETRREYENRLVFQHHSGPQISVDLQMLSVFRCLIDSTDIHGCE